MPPKRKAASKSKKAEPIAIEDDMSRITVRRPLKNNESGTLKDEDLEVHHLPIETSEYNSNMNAMVVIEKMPDVHTEKEEFEETGKPEDSNKKSILKKNVLTKVAKSESKKKIIEDGKVSKKVGKRAASEDRQTNKNEEKVVSSKSKKRLVDKDLSEPSSSHLNERLKRNRRAASVDVLTKNSSSVVTEPKKMRKGKKGSIVETTENSTKRHRRSSSLDSLEIDASPVIEVPKKIRKAPKAVETVDDKPKKNPKVIIKKESKTLGRKKKEEKNVIKELLDEKENVDVLPIEQNIAEEIEGKVRSTITLSKEEIIEELEMKDNSEKVPKQISSKSRGKRQVVKKVAKSKRNKSSEESSGKTDSDDSDVLKTSEQPVEEQDLELVEDSSEKMPKQAHSKSRGKRQATQKHISKTNKLSEESSGKSNTDDSDMTKSPEIKPKRIGKHKETEKNDNEIKLPKRRACKVKTLEEEDILSNIKTEDLTDNIPDTLEFEKKLVPTVVKRRAKAKPAKK